MGGNSKKGLKWRVIFGFVMAVNCALAVTLGVIIFNLVGGGASKSAYNADGTLVAANIGAGVEAPRSGTVAAAEPVANVKAKIASGVSVNGIVVGGLTAEQALSNLSAKLPDGMLDYIKVTSGEAAYSYSMFELGAGFDINGAVADAQAAAKDAKITAKILYNKDFIDEKVSEIAELVYKAPINPTMKKDEDDFHITGGAEGAALESEALAESIINAVVDNYGIGGATVAATTKGVSPAFSEADLTQSQDLLGTFTTKFNASQTNRNQNIKTACEKITNRIVAPGETFSTNAEFGETTYDKGWRMAGTYQNGRVVEGMGGGMCQVSSTLYNALLFAELNIVERQNHSMAVAYVPMGFDATLAGDYIDLKFMNDTAKPVMVEAIMTTNTITVNIYGHETRNPGRSLKFEHELVGSGEPAAELVTYDSNLPLNERVYDVSPKSSYNYKLYKYAYQDGVLLNKSQVNTSNYRSVRGEVRVGTGPAAPVDLSAHENVPATNPTANGFVQTAPDELKESVQPPAEQPTAVDTYPDVILPPDDGEDGIDV